MPKRKPVPPPLPDRPDSENKPPGPKPPLPKRKPIITVEHAGRQPDELLVIEAPQDSAPDSPADIDTGGDLTETMEEVLDSSDQPGEDHTVTDDLSHDDQKESGLEESDQKEIDQKEGGQKESAQEGAGMDMEAPNGANPAVMETPSIDKVDT